MTRVPDISQPQDVPAGPLAWLKQWLVTLRLAWQVRDPQNTTVGDVLDKFVDRRELVDVGLLVRRSGGGFIAGVSSGIPGPQGPPGPPGEPGAEYTPDLTPPPTPTGLTAQGAIFNILLGWDNPTYTQGRGHGRTLIYGAIWQEGTPAPTFGDARTKLIDTAGGAITVHSYPTTTGTRFAFWIKWQSIDGVASVNPAGGTNGVVAGTGFIGNVNLGPLIVEAGNLAAGAVTAAAFNSSIEPVTLVLGALPTTRLTSTIFLASDSKLYRWNGSSYVTSVPAVDITGQLTNAQIADLAAAKLTGSIVSTQIANDAITTPKIFAGAITTAKIAADAVTATQIATDAITAAKIAAGAVTAGKIAANSITSNEIAADAITAGQLAAGAVTAGKIAANAIAVGSAAIQNGAIVNAMLGTAAVDDAKVANLSAAKLTAGDGTIGGNLRSANWSPGLAGWQIQPNGYAEFNNVVVRATLFSTAGQIGGFTIGATFLQSSNFVQGSSGLRMLSNGNAEFNNVTLRGSQLAGGSFTGAHNVAGGSIFSANYAPGASGWALTETSAQLPATAILGTLSIGNVPAGALNSSISIGPTGQLLNAGGGQVIATPVIEGRRTANNSPSYYAPTGATGERRMEFKAVPWLTNTENASNVNNTDIPPTGSGAPTGTAFWGTLETIAQFGQGTGAGNLVQYLYTGDKTFRRFSLDTPGAFWGAWVQDLDRNAYTGDLNATFGATAAQAEAIAAATSQIAAISSDSVLSRGEKPALILQWQAQAADFSALMAQGATFGIGAERIAYDAAFNATAAYLTSLSPGWTDIGADTPIVGAELRASFVALYSARQTLLNAIDAASRTLAINAQNTANGAVSALDAKLNRSAADTLAAPITLATGGAIRAGDTTNGVVMAPSGLAGYKAGQVTFSINTTGDVLVRGTVAVGDAANSGTTMTGTGAVLNASGPFALGIPSKNIAFNGTDAPRLNGPWVTSENLNLSGFSLSIAGGNISQLVASGVSFGPASIGSRTASASGGTAPITFSWTLIGQAPNDQAGIWVGLGISSETVRIDAFCQPGGDALQLVRCTATDANGLTTSASFTARITSLS